MLQYCMVLERVGAKLPFAKSPSLCGSGIVADVCSKAAVCPEYLRSLPKRPFRWAGFPPKFIGERMLTGASDNSCPMAFREA